MTSPDYPVMYDSVDPAMIPAGAEAAALYGDGPYAVSETTIKRFPRHLIISVTGAAYAAHYARVLDIEHLDANPAQFPPFAQQRYELHHDEPIGYESLDNVGAVLEAITAAKLEHWLLWVAWWWNYDVPPTPEQVCAELLSAYGVTLDPDRLFGCQWKTGKYDTSALYKPLATLTKS